MSHTAATNLEWEDLYNFQKKYRSDHNITAPALLRHLKLPTILLSYLYVDSIYPSVSSLGGKLRTAIKSMRKSSDDSSDLFTLENTTDDLLEDYFRNNKEAFSSLGIFSINIASDGILKINCEREVKHDDVIPLFIKCEVEEIQKLLSNMQIEVFYQCYSKFDSPLAITSEKRDTSFGTMTPIIGEFGLFGVTARHCLVSSNPNNDVEYVVYGYPY